MLKHHISTICRERKVVERDFSLLDDLEHTLSDLHGAYGERRDGCFVPALQLDKEENTPSKWFI